MGQPESESAESKGIDKILKAGADIAGGVVGAAIGLLAAGPPGAFLGAAAGPAVGHTLQHCVEEFRERRLGKRETARIGAAVAFAATKIDAHLRAGKQLRQDGFFGPDVDGRSPADEILEGVLLAAQREHEERKIAFYSNLMANLAFESRISRAHANHLLKIGQGLSYRQLCILGLFARKERTALRQRDYREETSLSQETISLLGETYDLYTHGLIDCSGEAMLGLADVNPVKINVQGTGTVLALLMELHTLPADDVEQVARLLG